MHGSEEFRFFVKNFLTFRRALLPLVLSFEHFVYYQVDYFMFCDCFEYFEYHL